MYFCTIYHMPLLNASLTAMYYSVYVVLFQSSCDNSGTRLVRSLLFSKTHIFKEIPCMSTFVHCQPRLLLTSRLVIPIFAPSTLFGNNFDRYVFFVPSYKFERLHSASLPRHVNERVKNCQDHANKTLVETQGDKIIYFLVPRLLF